MLSRPELTPRADAAAAIDPELIIDVGMHRGEDTEFYLRKGFRVVAIEANPVLAASVAERLAAYIVSGQLQVLNLGIAAAPGKARFGIADEASVWGSLSEEFIRRNERQGVRYRYVEIDCVRFEDILRAHGVPYYLKIDIEGIDMECVRALHGVAARPRFVSIESAVTSNHAVFGGVFAELAHLWVLGYRSFKYVNQRDNPRRACPNPPREGRYVPASFNRDSSGPFGEETPGEWRSIAATLRRATALMTWHNLVGYNGRWADHLPGAVYRRLHRGVFGTDVSWYDLHARLG
jgi:FkbM family methyltransferase